MTTAEQSQQIDELRASLKRDDVPERLHDGLIRYIVFGIKPGDFLTAVLENNLYRSVSRADDGSLAGLHRLVAWVYNEAPGGCWGSNDEVAAWCKLRTAKPAGTAP